MIGPKTTLTVQRITIVADVLGAGGTESWTNLTTITGVLTNPKYGYAGTERFSIKKDTVYTSHMFYCDVPSDVTVTEKDRFTYGTRVFNIMLIQNPGNMNHHLEFFLSEIV